MLRAILCAAFAACVLLPGGPALSQPADAIDTHLRTNNPGLDAQTHAIDADNEGFSLWPSGAALPLNPSGSVPFSFAFGGDAIGGDLYCLAEDEYLSLFPGAWGCIYGRSVHGTRVGPVILQANQHINMDGGTGGPGMIMWADRENADTHGNQGYMDIWAWGNGTSDFSNSLNFGNRDSAGNPHRRLRIRNSGQIQFPDLAGSGNAHLCLGPDGTIYRGGASGC